jgi:protein-L-isoaspartate(D-aspartate) O-methyltransferase
LAVGGRLVMPVGKRRRHQDLILLRRSSEEEYSVEKLSPVAFVPLIGEEGWRKG